MSGKRKHTIDIRFTWTGDKAKEFIDLVKEEYGQPLPYGAVGQLIRLVCIKYVNARSKKEEE